MADIYIALIHHPVYNKGRKIVASCITGVDLHDIARSALTYGIKRYFVVNPMPAQIKFAERIIGCWRKSDSFVHNWTRAEAFKLVELAPDLESVIKKLKNPILVATSARPQGKIKFPDLKRKLKVLKRPVLLLFGTGWGLAEEVLDQADLVLEPIQGFGSYNHLSVRSAVAIVLDRLLAKV
ncbi:MAG: RNA methyltransferase [Candidatus Margulisiibacteriota bacterium]